MTVGVQNRRRAVLEMVLSEGFVSTSDLADRLGVSEMSIRRDAEALSSHPSLARVRGGLVAVREPAAPSAGTTATGGMEQIASVAVRRLASDSVIMIDAGRTALAFARAIPAAFRGTVISHSLPVLDLMVDRPEVTTIGLGGELYCRSRAFVGSAAISALERLRAEFFFMGAASVGPDGTFAARDVERHLKRAMMEASQRTVVLVGHEKFAAAAPVFIAPWSTHFTILTDAPVAPAAATRILEAGATIEVAPPATVP